MCFRECEREQCLCVCHLCYDSSARAVLLYQSSCLIYNPGHWVTEGLLDFLMVNALQIKKQASVNAQLHKHLWEHSINHILSYSKGKNWKRTYCLNWISHYKRDTSTCWELNIRILKGTWTNCTNTWQPGDYTSEKLLEATVWKGEFPATRNVSLDLPLLAPALAIPTSSTLPLWEPKNCYDLKISLQFTLYLLYM